MMAEERRCWWKNIILCWRKEMTPSQNPYDIALHTDEAERPESAETTIMQFIAPEEDRPPNATKEPAKRAVVIYGLFELIIQYLLIIVILLHYHYE